MQMGGSIADWLETRVLDSGTVGPGFKLQLQCCQVSLRQTVHTHCASVHQAAKLLAAFLRVAGVTAGLAGMMAAYLWVYDSCHLQADCKEPGSALEPCAQ